MRCTRCQRGLADGEPVSRRPGVWGGLVWRLRRLVHGSGMDVSGALRGMRPPGQLQREPSLSSPRDLRRCSMPPCSPSCPSGGVPRTGGFLDLSPLVPRRRWGRSAGLPVGAEVLLQNTTKATTIATMARVKEMPSTQRTTPVVSPCRTLVAVSISGCRSDIRNLNATASARFGYHRIESTAHDCVTVRALRSTQLVVVGPMMT